MVELQINTTQNVNINFTAASVGERILAYGIDKKLNSTALYTYLQLNYLPAPMSMFEGVNKLLPGHYLKVKNNEVEVHQYYDITIKTDPFEGDFNGAVNQFQHLTYWKNILWLMLIS